MLEYPKRISHIWKFPAMDAMDFKVSFHKLCYNLFTHWQQKMIIKKNT